MSLPAARAVAIVRDRLASEPTALPFVVAVTTQLTGHAGPLATAPDSEQAELAQRVAEIVLGARGEVPMEELVARLLEEPPLAAAFFQNVDLLYMHDYRHADAVGALIMRAMEIAAHAEARG